MSERKNIEVVVLNSHGVGQICHVKRLPRRGETMEAWGWRVEEDGGKGCTVSVALGRLGIRTGYIGKVGYDPWGDMGEKWMREAGVDTAFMYRDHSVSTGTGLIMVDEDGLNTIVDGDSACSALTMDEVRAALAAMREARFMITGFGMPWQKSLAGAQMAKEEFEMQTFCNTSPLPAEGDMGDLSFIDYVVLNDVEGRVLMGLPENSPAPYEELCRGIAERHRCGGVIMTCGEKGSAVLDRDGSFWTVAPTEVRAVDTIGAGDGYLAATVAGLVRGKTLREATQWASKYSAFKVTRKGTVGHPGYPYLHEVEEFIAGLQGKAE